MASTKGPRKPGPGDRPKKPAARDAKGLPLTCNAVEKAGGAAKRNTEMVWRRRRDLPLKPILATHPKLAVLIVHDNPTTRLVMRRALTALGVPKIAEAEDDADALERIRNSAPDLVILGHEMANGLELLKQIRHDENRTIRALPVIMTINAPTAQQIRDISNAGAHEILVTPLSASVLVRHIIGIFTEDRKHIETDDYIGPERRDGSDNFSGEDRRDPGKE